LQRRLISPIRPDGKKETYELIKDVETRWNSFDDSAERALYLRPAIDELLMVIRMEYEEYVLRQRQRNRPATRKAPAILQDALDEDDWHTIKLYHEILAPFKKATLQLQGQVGGRFGAIWQVIPIYEQLLKHFEDLRRQYPVKAALIETQLQRQPTFDNSLTDVATQITGLPDDQTTFEAHLSANINGGWQKLNKYYELLNNLPIYVAAVVLHPRMKWRYLEGQWSHQTNSKGRNPWLKKAKTAFHELSLQYHDKEVDYMDNNRPVLTSSPLKRRHMDWDDWLEDTLSDDEEGGAVNGSISKSMEQQITEYNAEPRHKTLLIKVSPIDWWLGQRERWPQLSAMALDIYSTPAMSDEPERIFSATGAAVSPRRRLLKSETIRWIMCLKSWIRSGLVNLNKTFFNQVRSEITPCLKTSERQTTSTSLSNTSDNSLVVD